MSPFFRCADCKHFNPEPAMPGTPLGTCQRHAPRGPIVMSGEVSVQLFPMMAPTAWCGELERSLIVEVKQ